MRSLRRPSSASFVADSGLAAHAPFLQWLAFGMTFTPEEARDPVEWAAQCQQDWAAAHGATMSGASRADRLTLLRETHEAVVASAMDRIAIDRPVTMGLSGGFDSRAIIAVLSARPPLPLLYTYGRPGSVDFDTVALLARDQGVAVRLVDTTDLDWDRDTLIERLRGTRDRILSPRMIVGAALDRECGPRSEIHGQLNGSLTGARGPRPPSPTWEAALADFSAGNDPFSLQGHLHPDVVRALLPASPASTPLSFDHQLELGLRQFQRIRPVSTATCQYVLPFEDARWVGLWLTTTAQDRLRQSLWSEHLQSLRSTWFPDLDSRTDSAESPQEARARWLVDARGQQGAPRRAAGDAGPRRPAAELCWWSAYRDSPGFRHLVDDGLQRLRGARVFDETFVQGCTDEFGRGTAAGVRRMRALVSTELALAAGLFDR